VCRGTTRHMLTILYSSYWFLHGCLNIIHAAFPRVPTWLSGVHWSQSLILFTCPYQCSWDCSTYSTTLCTPSSFLMSSYRNVPLLSTPLMNLRNAFTQLSRPVLDSHASKGWKAELAWVDWLSTTKTVYPRSVTHLSTNLAQLKSNFVDATNDVSTKPNC